MGKAREEVVEVLFRSWNLDGASFARVIDDIKEYESIIAEAGGIAGSGFVDFEHYGYDGGFEIVIKYRRLESDREYESRQKREARELEKERERKAKAKEQRRKEFEKLKKEFGE